MLRRISGQLFFSPSSVAEIGLIFRVLILEVLKLVALKPNRIYETISEVCKSFLLMEVLQNEENQKAF